MLVGINKDLLNGFATILICVDFVPNALPIFTSHMQAFQTHM